MGHPSLLAVLTIVASPLEGIVMEASWMVIGQLLVHNINFITSINLNLAPFRGFRYYHGSSVDLLVELLILLELLNQILLR